MPKIKAILFDLDGTVADSALDLSLAVNYMLDKLGFPEQPKEAIYGYIGRGVRNMLTQALGPENKDRIDEGLRFFREHYWDHCLDHTLLYPGVEETVRSLDGVKKAVVTNKARDFTHKILKGLDVFDDYDIVLGGDEFPKMKPAPEPVLMACDLLGVKPEEAIMVGDSTNDIISAREAGAHAMGVTWGLGLKSELVESGAKWLIDSIGEIKPLLVKIGND